MAVQLFYLFAFAVNFLIFINFICRKEYQNGVNFFISIVMLVRSYGQFMLSISDTLEMALFANKVFYFGSAFLPTLLFIASARLCKIELPMITEHLAISYSCLIMFFALTIGKSDIYYSEVRLVRNITENGAYTTLAKEYGPAHIFYNIMMVAYFFGFLWLAFMTYRKRNTVSRKVITGVSVIAIGIILLYMTGKVIYSPISFTSVAYLVAAIFSVRIISNSEMHDLTGCILDALGENSDEGFVVFDAHERYINANAKAKEIYPEINDLAVGKVVPDTNSDFCRQVANRVKEYRYDLYDRENTSVIERGDKKYETKLNDIVFRKGSTSAGVFVEFEDVTVRENIARFEEKYRLELEADVEKKTKEIRNMLKRLVLGLATIVESRDSSTGEHIVRTNEGMKIFAEKLKAADNFSYSNEYFDAICLAMPMHDLGKIAIDDEKLRCSAKSASEEELMIKLHTEEGSKIVRKVLGGLASIDKGERFTEIAANIANYHHERWDGSGLPYGLKGREIPMEARIASFIDCLDTLIEDGDDTGRKSFDEAFGMMVNAVGTKFDPELGTIFVRCRQELKALYEGQE